MNFRRRKKSAFNDFERRPDDPPQVYAHPEPDHAFHHVENGGQTPPASPKRTRKRAGTGLSSHSVSNLSEKFIARFRRPSESHAKVMKHVQAQPIAGQSHVSLHKVHQSEEEPATREMTPPLPSPVKIHPYQYRRDQPSVPLHRRSRNGRPRSKPPSPAQSETSFEVSDGEAEDLSSSFHYDEDPSLSRRDTAAYLHRHLSSLPSHVDPKERWERTDGNSKAPDLYSFEDGKF